jgi:hypothetical protein
VKRHAGVLLGISPYRQHSKSQAKDEIATYLCADVFGRMSQKAMKG